VLIKEWRLLQRAVFVIDGSGSIEHVEYVRDQMTEPDYDLAVEAARELRVVFREGTEKSRSEG
jgi:thiol peroxidase